MRRGPLGKLGHRDVEPSAADAVDGGTEVFVSQGEFATEERLLLHRNGLSRAV